MPSLLILIFVIAFAITPHVAIAQFVPTEIVYENSQGDVSVTHARLEEFGDEIILAGDNRKIIRFEFEYFGKFEADGDETCVLRFYRNDGEALVIDRDDGEELVIDDKAPGTLIYESQPFTLLPGYNTAVIQGINVEVPDKFTWTVKFDGLTGFSKDRAALVLTDPPNIGKSFDDFWVRFGNGWNTWRFKGDPIANFACKAISEYDLAANDAPTLGDAGGTLPFTENGGATAIDGSLSVADLDDTHLESAAITISSGYVSSEDVLGFRAQNGISGIWDSESGVMSLSGTSSKANYETALESLTYNNTSEDPNTSARTITWVINDGYENSSAVTSAVSVTVVNDAPTIATNTGVSVARAGSVIITASFLKEGDPDDSGAGLTYAVTSAPVNGQLELTTGAGVAIANFSQEDIDNSRVIYKHDGSESLEDSFAFSLVDGGEDEVSAATGTFSISVATLNDAPTVVTNTGGTVKESETLVITGAMLQAMDPDDAPAGLTYTVTSASVNGQLELTTGAGVPITVFTQEDIDSDRVIYKHDGGESLEDGFAFSLADGGEDEVSAVPGTFNISVIAVNDSPTVAINTGVSLTESGSVSITALMLNEGDPDDSGAGLIYTVTSAPGNGQLELTTGAGVPITVFTQEDIDKGRVIYQHDGSENLEGSFAFSLADGGEDEVSVAAGTFNITVIAVNDAPTIATNGGGTVKESENFVITNLKLQASDPDDAPTGLTYTVTSAPVNGQLELTTVAGVLITSFTQEDIDNARVIYKHDGSERLEDSFAFSLADGGEDEVSAVTGTFNITVIAVNDAPTVAVNTGVTLTESDSVSITALMLNEGDPDDSGAGLIYTVTTAPSNGQLELTTAAGVIITSFTQEDIDNLRVIYKHDGSENLEDSFAFSLVDGGEDETAPIESVFNINVTELNDAPTVSGLGGALTFTENDGATVIDGNLIVTDADDTDLQSAIIHISSGYNHSEDVLGFNNQSGIAGIWDAESGTMTLSGKASMTNYETALESLTYNNTSDAPNTDSRTITWVVNDGIDNSLKALSTVVVNAINDVPALLDAGDSLAFTENDGAKIIDRTLSVVDVDDTHLESATIIISTGYVSREDVLEFQAQNGITGNWEPENGIMSLTGSASKANYETALESVTYNNTSDTPNTSSRIITWVLNDGNDSSAKVTSIVSVTAVNDSPLAQDDTYSVDEDGKLVVPVGSGVLSNDSIGGDGGALVVSAHTSPFSGTLALSEDGSLIYTPNPDFNGFDTFKYTIADIDGTTSTGVVTITVNSVNDSPLAQDDSYTVDEDNTLTVEVDSGLLSNDSIGGDGGALTVKQVTVPDKGTLILDSDGSFSYVPLPDYNGNDRFTYSIADSDGDTDTATVTVIVNSVDDSPLAQDDSYSVDEDGRLIVEGSIGLLVNDNIGGDGGVLVVSSNTSPLNGTLKINEEGSLMYIPSPDFNGSDAFMYTITDIDGTTSTGSVSIDVKSVNDHPLAQDDSYSVDEDNTLRVELDRGLLSNDSIGGDGGTLAATLVTEPENGTLTLNSDGSFTYTPIADYNGTDSFTYSIADSDGDADIATVLIVVVAEPGIPPSFNIQPSDSFLPQGSGLTLDFGVTGSEPMQYQWFLNGERLLGADQPTLPILPNIMRENSGSYVFRAENSSDTVISEAVIVSLDWQNFNGADDFAEAIAIESNSGFIRTSNSQATTENGEPRHSNKRTGNTIWYRWQPAASGLATLSLQGSSFDTVMAVYEGNSLTQLTEIESDDDRGGFSTSRLQFNAELGQDYMIAIGGFNGANGNILFSWEIDITQVVSFPRITIIPEYNTVSIGEPYQLTTSISGNIEDVQLQWIHNNIPIPGATGTTLDIATAQAGDAGVYWISVTVGDTTDRTKYAHMTVNVPRRGKIIRELVLEQKFADLFFNVLDLNPQPQFQPQLFGSIFQSRAASLATGFTGAQIFNTFGAVKEAGEPDHCGIAGGASQWFAYQSPTDGELTISTDGSDFDTVMGVYTSTGSSFGDLIEITCDNDSGADGLDSSVTFNASKDTIYYVAVDGVEAATGIVNLAYELEVGLTVQSVTIADLGMQFEIQTVPDITFVIEGTEDFENWVELISTSSVDGNFNYIDNEALISDRRFYRVYVTD